MRTQVEGYMPLPGLTYALPFPVFLAGALVTLGATGALVFFTVFISCTPPFLEVLPVTLECKERRSRLCLTEYRCTHKHDSRREIHVTMGSQWSKWFALT